MDHLKSIEKNRKIIRKMMINAAFGITLMEISGAIAYIIDGVITSRFLGSDALAASGMAGVCFTILAIISGVIAAGSQQIYCNELGDVKLTDKSSSFVKVFTFTAIISVIVAIIGMAASGLLASAVGASAQHGELHVLTRNYMIAFFIGAPAHIFSAVLIPAVQLNGDNKRITLSLLVLLIVNTAADLLNVLVIHGGMFGMGLATSISYYAGAFVLATSFMKKDSIFKIGFKLPDLALLRNIFDIGLPRATKRLGNFIRPFFINNLIMIAGGSTAMAAFTVEQNVRYITESVGVGVGGAAFLLAGIFINENDYTSLKQMSKETLNTIMVVISALSLIYFVTAPLITRLYLSPDSSSFDVAITVLRCHAVSLPFLAFNEYYTSLTQATGRIKLTHLVTILNKLVYIVALSFIFYKIMGLMGIWLAIPLSEVLLCLSIFLCTAIRNKKNPLRSSPFSLFDEYDNSNSSEIEISIKNTTEIGRAKDLIIQFCNEHNFDNRTSYMIRLFFEEVCLLIIQQGFENKKNRSIDIRIMCDDENIVLRTKDNCKPFDHQQRQMIMKGTFEDDDYIGISMVSKLAKNIEYISVMNINNFIVIL